MSDIPDFGLVVPAAGSGSRTGTDIPKQFIEILGEPVLRHTLSAFAAVEECRRIVVAVDPMWRKEAEACAAGMAQVTFVEGGDERQHSVRSCMDAMPRTMEFVLVHDAARPAVSPELVRRVVRAAAEHGAALPVLPIAETIKRLDDDNRIVETIPRDGLFTAQTPQGFRADLLRAACEHALIHGILGTDDASLVELVGGTVVGVRGEWANVKITWTEDFERVERTLSASRSV